MTENIEVLRTYLAIVQRQIRENAMKLASQKALMNSGRESAVSEKELPDVIRQLEFKRELLEDHKQLIIRAIGELAPRKFGLPGRRFRDR